MQLLQNEKILLLEIANTLDNRNKWPSPILGWLVVWSGGGMASAAFSGLARDHGMAE